MKYNFTDLVDIQSFEKLMKDFYSITGIPHGLLDKNGNILSSIGWQSVCTNFHRKYKKSAIRCKESDLAVNRVGITDKGYGIYVCKNGLVEAFTPIKLEGEDVAYIVFGQFFLDKPDIDYFKKQGKELGYNEKEYIDALLKVPVITMAQVDNCMSYYTHLSELLSKSGYAQLRQKEIEGKLKKSNEDLENLVEERTSKLAEDLAERKIIEEKLRDSEKRYRDLIELLPYGIFVRIDNEIVFANKTAAKYFALDKPEDLIGKNINQLFYPHPDSEKEFYNHFEEIKENGIIPLREEKLIRVCDGKVLELETIRMLIEFNGKKATLIVNIDISEKKSLEEINRKMEESTKLLNEALEYDRLKTEFFANISHELRTPINVILSALQMCAFMLNNEKMKNDTNSLNKYFEMMRINCFRLIRLVNNLLDISRLDTGSISIEYTNCDIVKIIEDIVTSVAEYVKDAGVEIVFDTEIEEKVISVDPEKIERIMLNLLSNAVKFSGTNGRIFVSVYERNKKLFVSIKDEGIGIPEEKLKYIFDRFVQVDKSFSRSSEGSGIGLSIVKSLVELHGGNIYVKSKINVGSEFIVELPIRKLPKRKLSNRKYFGDYSNLDRVKIEFSDVYFYNLI